MIVVCDGLAGLPDLADGDPISLIQDRLVDPVLANRVMAAARSAETTP